MSSAMLEGYRAARIAQEERAEEYSRGYPEELDKFYGRGEYVGCGIERPITWRSYLESWGNERRAWEDAQARRRAALEAWADRQAAKHAAYLGECAAADRWDAEQRAARIDQVFRMSGRALAQAAAAGDRYAAAEQARRAANKAARLACRDHTYRAVPAV